MFTFADAKFKITKFPASSGIKGTIPLDNGNMEISIVMNECSYGGNKGLWEVAVFEKKGDLTMPRTVELKCLNNDVAGNLTFPELEKKLVEIQKELKID